MRVLFCHNYYRYRGGEDESFDSEVAMLREFGHEVTTYTRNNSDLGDSVSSKVGTTAKTLFNPASQRDAARLIAETKPDILHCNNLFPQISHSIYRAAVEAGVPIVQALRNYRTFCVNSFFFRDGKVCTDCLNKTTSFSGIRHACYRGSRMASTVVTAMQFTQRFISKCHRDVNLFLTPTEFSKSVYVEGGFDRERICVKPNFVYPDPGEGSGSSKAFIYVGRLSSEKGLNSIMQAWQDSTASLKIVGDGPLREEIASFAKMHPNVEFLGKLDLPAVIELMGEARCLIIPSLWYETFGRTIVEAFSRGTPVIASGLGAMAELVTDGESGLLFEAGNANELRNAVDQINQMPDGAYKQFRSAARNRFLSEYTRERNYSRLIEIYEKAKDQHRAHS